MFDLEFILRQKAQLKYLQVKQKNQTTSKIASMLNHSFLWSPTPMYYLTTLTLFVVLRRKFRLQWLTFLSVLMIPITLDYLKRDYYIKMEKKEYKEFQEATSTVRNILTEKKQCVTLEQVLSFCFHLNMDNKVDQRKLLPISYF